MQETQSLQFNFMVDAIQANKRIDQMLAHQYPDYSRVRWQKWIQDGAVLVNQKNVNAKYKLHLGETIMVNAVFVSEPLTDLPQNINLDIIYEDNDLLIINKPVGMVVHPAVGNRNGTLLNALLHHVPQLNKLPRAGIVHRIDKDTSGLLMIGKNIKTCTYLTKKLQAHYITR